MAVHPTAGPPATVRRGENDAGGRREQLLEALRRSPQPRSIVSLAGELGVHANTVRFHLESLQRAGRVEQLLAETAGPGRPPVLFRATHRMDPAGPTNYRLLAGMLTGHLAATAPDPIAAATRLGRAWGPHPLGPATVGGAPGARVRRGEALTRMTGILGELGFAPESPTGPRDGTIRLRHCPFLGLVTAHDTQPGVATGEVICALHLGLMQGAFDSLQAPVTVDRLEPFVEPDLCVAHLVPVAPLRPAGE